MRMHGKAALVTGGASGFGAGIARAFRADGAEVAIADVDAEAVQAMADVLGAHPIVADVSVDESVAHLASAALGILGRIDVLVNNAGVTHAPMALEDVPETEFDRVFRVNAKSVYLTARHVIPSMKARGSGVVLNIASTAGLSPRPLLNWYNASKGWVIAATKTMAIELAAHGVRVNALCPVAGETPMLKCLLGEDTPENRARFLATIPMGRFSTPHDVGSAAAFLCSDEAAFLTGVALEVDGGRCI